MNMRRIKKKLLEKQKKKLLSERRIYRQAGAFPPGFVLDCFRRLKWLDYEIKNGFPPHLENNYHAFTCLVADRKELLRRAAQRSTGHALEEKPFVPLHSLTTLPIQTQLKF